MYLIKYISGVNRACQMSEKGGSDLVSVPLSAQFFDESVGGEISEDRIMGRSY